MDEWAALEEPWRVCLELAWEAYRAGTIPVGSVVVGPDGGIVARGRNRIFEPPDGSLAGTRLAHAEVTARRRPRRARASARSTARRPGRPPCSPCSRAGRASRPV